MPWCVMDDPSLRLPEAIVRNWAGHLDAETLKIYTHINNQASQAAMQQLSDGSVENGKK